MSYMFAGDYSFPAGFKGTLAASQVPTSHIDIGYMIIGALRFVFFNVHSSSLVNMVL